MNRGREGETRWRKRLTESSMNLKTVQVPAAINKFHLKSPFDPMTSPIGSIGPFLLREKKKKLHRKAERLEMFGIDILCVLRDKSSREKGQVCHTFPVTYLIRPHQLQHLHPQPLQLSFQHLRSTTRCLNYRPSKGQSVPFRKWGDGTEIQLNQTNKEAHKLITHGNK